VSIPRGLPSSYHGKLIKYQYFLLLNFDEKKIKIPIFIHQRTESKSSPKSLIWKWNKYHQKNIDPILPDWEVNTSHYDVVFNNRSICQVVLEKLTFITGEEIFGLFDFNKSELHCIKVSIPLF
jgi:hypothetical protein